MNPSSRHFPLLLAAFALLIFTPFLGSAHLFDWDEINFSECAREMIVTGNYAFPQINFLPFWEKPPLFIWMQALSMHAFGINEFAARFPNVLCSVLTLLTLFRIGKKLRGHTFGLYWVLLYAGSVLPHFYFRSAIIDPWFNLFIFLGAEQIILGLHEESAGKRPLLAGMWTGLAMLTKGPVALLIVLLCLGVHLLIVRGRGISFLQALRFGFAFLLSGGSWFIYLILSGKSELLGEFILYQVRLFSTEDAGHGGPFFYHALVLLFGCFPASVFALSGNWRPVFTVSKGHRTLEQEFHRWMRILFWVTLILFSVVQTKIVHYSSLCYFPLTFFAAVNMQRLLSGELRWKSRDTFLAVLTGGVLSLAFVAAPLIEHLETYLLKPGVLRDEFAKANLEAEAAWMGWEWIPGLVFAALLGYLILAQIGRKVALLQWIPLATLAVTSLMMVLVVPRVEEYSQGAAIAFYKSKAGENCSVETYGFKSYAHLFYAAQKKNTGLPSPHMYLVSRITKAEELQRQCPECIELFRKNGFVFWEKRQP
ncbi:MAG: glycosyltransferase family 39 protein [Bacteroidia bacterium]|nr:glycosyltransferase family 39 protein [Bacteroidia bacterium]